MRSFKISIVLLIIIVVSSIAYIICLNKTTDDFLKQIVQLEEAVKQERWDKAEQQLDHIQEIWKKKEKWMSTLIDHQEIDNIKIALAQLTEYVHHKEITDFMAETASLKILIRHIPEKEKINLVNIF